MPAQDRVGLGFRRCVRVVNRAGGGERDVWGVAGNETPSMPYPRCPRAVLEHVRHRADLDELGSTVGRHPDLFDAGNLSKSRHRGKVMAAW
jgi:hypothetical protein